MNMTVEPLLAASLAIQIHVFSAICAVFVGPLALFRNSRDRWHKRLGYFWVVAMFMAATSSFAILESPMIGPFSIIHGLSVFTLWGLWEGIRAIKRGDIARHRGQMRALYFWALGVAGLFTFIPGRRMNRVFFPDMPETGFVIAAVVIGGLLTWYVAQSRLSRG